MTEEAPLHIGLPVDVRSKPSQIAKKHEKEARHQLLLPSERLSAAVFCPLLLFLLLPLATTEEGLAGLLAGGRPQESPGLGFSLVVV